jgi:hypothetical protein
MPIAGDVVQAIAGQPDVPGQARHKSGRLSSGSAHLFASGYPYLFTSKFYL